MQEVTPGLLCALFSQIAAVSAFAQTLRRYTSLNHLAQAARAVLQNTSQINQMLSDLNRVDFANVQVRTALCVGYSVVVLLLCVVYYSFSIIPTVKRIYIIFLNVTFTV